MFFILILLLAFLTWTLPLPGKIILLAINYFLPDPLPFGDEIVQIIGIVKTIVSKAIDIIESINWKWFWGIVIIILCVLIIIFIF